MAKIAIVSVYVCWIFIVWRIESTRDSDGKIKMIFVIFTGEALQDLS